MATGIIIHQLLIFGLLALLGAMGSHLKIITEEIKESLSRIIIDITLPFLILSTFSGLSFEPGLVRNAFIVFMLTFINIGILYLTGTTSSRLQRLMPQQATVHTLHTMLGNIVFLGFPLFDALFPGGIGVFYAAIYQLASNTITFTYGIYRLSAGTQKSGLKSLININTGALAIGILIFSLGIKLPSPMIDAFSGLGKCTSPLSMIYIGALLAGMNIRHAFEKVSVYIICINKLIIIPIILGFVYTVVFHALNIVIAKEAFFVLVMQSGMPCQTIVVVLTKRYGGDTELAASNLFVTTMLSIVTLPLLYLVLEKILIFFN